MTTSELKNELDTLSGQIPGRVAYAMDHPASGSRVERAGEDAFVAASVIKVPILMEAFHQVKAGELRWDEPMVLRAEDKVDGSGVLNVLHDGLAITVRDCAVLMTVVSDNTGTNMMLDRLGVENVNRFLTNHGCTATRCIRKLYDEDAISKGIHNYIAAGEITRLFTLAAQGSLNGPEWDADMIGIFKNQQYRERLPHLLPRDAVTATKSGSLDSVSHDSGVVYLPNGDWFTACFCFGDLKGFEDDLGRDAANLVMAKMALACYRFAESAVS